VNINCDTFLFDNLNQYILRIRNKGFGSGSGQRLVSDPEPDSNPDPDPGFLSRSETGQNFFITNFYPAFTHKKAAFP
jgi:hypothetical protein